MRVLYLFRSWAVWGGIERVLVDKMHHLASVFGIEVYMLTTCQGDHPVPYHLDSAVHFDDWGIHFHRQYQYRGLCKILDGYQRTHLFEKHLSERLLMICPNVIVCTTADPVNSIVKVKRFNPSCCRVTFYLFQNLWRKRTSAKACCSFVEEGSEKSFLRRCITESDAMEWRAFHPVVKVIPNIVHLNKRNIPNRQDKRFRWVGCFDYQKCPMEIVKIWQQIHLSLNRSAWLFRRQ